VTDLSTISNDQLNEIYSQLLSWCRDRDFAGHDPFDALNSRIFQQTPFASSRNARLVWTQLLKRSPADFRRIARVPLQRNAKGIALFALAHLADYRSQKTTASEASARSLLASLQEMKLQNYAGAAWGYNFDWQSRNFFAPRGTATIVPTAFAGRAFIEAAHAFKDQIYLQEARSICEFILVDLPRTVDTSTEVCFSYAPHTSTQIFNASLLAAEVLADVGAVTKEKELLDLAVRATRFVVNHQKPDGSWAYGMEPAQSWIDNFHTAYVLFSLDRILKSSPNLSEFRPALARGYEFWKDSFFLADGWPKYYHHQPYPVDVHAGATAIVTFLELAGFDSSATVLAEKVAAWLITNMRDERGFFYYQRRRFHTIRKPYMRWSQAWMLYALARLQESRAKVR
jgi:hypothetical protein